MSSVGRKINIARLWRQDRHNLLSPMSMPSTFPPLSTEPNEKPTPEGKGR
ncbi:hypothetical protein OP10G_3260 [Fimbriimonas ginsengisoli Gsoil 348]|uniref:Uncharacterized protein n=1 Tax=Fimbriimonas ginsengisoli Gsoil 348 TaxID=661478 RepID=A0A068NSY1_FIMGI|nr:hypothetical protein OP10G_3260 [Fimbriimonas ginsengisoli Gsoil 348]